MKALKCRPRYYPPPSETDLSKSSVTTLVERRFECVHGSPVDCQNVVEWQLVLNYM